MELMTLAGRALFIAIALYLAAMGLWAYGRIG